MNNFSNLVLMNNFFNMVKDGFNWIIDTAKALVQFVWTLINGLLELLELLPAAVRTLTDVIGVLPTVLLAFASATVTVSVIYLIANRQTGGSR